MKNLSRESWIMLGIAAAVVAAAVILVFLPQSRQVRMLRAQAVAEEAQLAADRAKTSVVPEVMRHIREMKSRYEGFDRRMPQQKELAGFLREISAVVASEDLANQLTEPGNPTRGKFYHTLPIIMKFQGSYLSLASLLERIDDMERLTRVQKLSIAKDSKSDGLVIELQMNIYFTES